MSKFNIQPTEIKRFENGEFQSKQDVLSIEDPLEIRVSHRGVINKVAITMRTPGFDKELAIGFLFTEGLLKDSADIENIQVLNHPNEGQIVKVEIQDSADFSIEKVQRNFYTTSSCGVCGKASIESVRTACEISNPQNNFVVESSILTALPKELRNAQESFSHTGGIHACALFRKSGEFLELFEDVGRHNALDKLIGAQLMKKNIPINNSILLLSGRASFELVQKAAMAGISIICAIGAPSSLAVELAEDLKICLVGFLKENRFNIYTEFNRIVQNL